MDRFRSMETFVRVARSGSFTTAANQLGLSRALVSRHVGMLEDRSIASGQCRSKEAE